MEKRKEKEPSLLYWQSFRRRSL